jgi:UDP-N-acetylmuramoyl-tripeptide--D-alanyl-D-alanine ligase
MLTLWDVVRVTRREVPWASWLEDVAVESACVDSREASHGSLFVAFEGEKVDGHAYVQDAFDRGAVAALVTRNLGITGAFGLSGDVVTASGPQLPLVIRVEDALEALQAIGRQQRQAHSALRVVGVTGSIGKTTTKEAIAAVLSAAHPTLKSEGKYNNEIGLPLTLTRLAPDHAYAVLEMGMYALGEIALLCDIAAPTIGVVTNVEPVHLERLGTLERIAEAKSELVRALPPDGLAVLNGDDPRVRAMAEMAACTSITYGLGDGNDYRAVDIVTSGLDGVRFRVLGPGGGVRMHASTLGRHQVMNLLAATAIGRAEGLAWEAIAEAVSAMGQGIRLIARQGGGGIQILDDTYNASPAATIGALEVLGAVAGRRVAVLGDMLELGAMEEEGHAKVGRYAAAATDLLVTVGEGARLIARAARSAGLALVWEVGSNAQAIDLLAGTLQAGDTVLVKGSRGMAMEEIVAALEEGSC